MKIHQRRFGRLLGLSIAAVLPIAMVVVATPAQAAPPLLGPLQITPATGNQSTLIDFSTLSNQACGAGTGSVQVIMTGGTLTEDLPGFVNGNTDYGLVTGPNGNIVASASQTLGQVFSAEGITNLSGVYTIRLQCLDSNLQVTGEFTNTTTWTPVSSGNGTYVAGSTATPTSTTLAVSVNDPIVAGTAVTLTATASPVTAGSVQFKRGATAIGAPVAVNGSGVATLVDTVLPAGTQSLTAVFTPTSGSFSPSTSAVRSYVVAGPATVAGTARVGSTLSCNSAATAGATIAYNWFFGTKQLATTTKTLKVPSTGKGLQAKCAVKTTKNAVTVTQTSPLTAKIAAGLAPVATKKPYITGTLRVAKVLTCNKGTWTSSPMSYKYQWYRGSTALSGKVYSTYKTVSTDKGKYLKCRVTTVKSGYAAGTAYSAAKKIL